MPITRSTSGRAQQEDAPAPPISAARLPASFLESPASPSETPRTEIAIAPSTSALTSYPPADVTRTPHAARALGEVQPPRVRYARSTTSSRQSDKARRLAEAKKKRLQLLIELAEQDIEAIQAETESEADDAEHDASQQRVDKWLDTLPVQSTPPAPQAEARSPARCVLPQSSAAHAAPPAGAAREPQATQRAPCAPPVAPPAACVPPQAPQFGLSDLAAAITSSLRVSQHSARHGDLPPFSGANREWLYFKAAYTESAAAFTETEKLARLRRCLRGAAREATDRLLVYGSTSANIMGTLERRFGRPDIVAQAELDSLLALQPPKDTPRDICVFASRYGNSVAALRALDRSEYLHNPAIVKATIEKLPAGLRYKWVEYAYETDRGLPDLLRIGNFLDREADRFAPFAQPETEVDSVPPRSSRLTERRNPVIQKPRLQRTYAATATKAPQCPVCASEGHHVYSCKNFLGLSSDDRWDQAKKLLLCFRCLQKRDRKHTCPRTECGDNGCKRSHHRLLHFIRPEQPSLEQQSTHTETVATATQKKKSRAYLKIVPVHVSGPAGEVDTLALIDDGSTITLVEDRLAREVGAAGNRDPLHIEGIGEQAINALDSRRVTLTLQGTDEPHRISANTVESTFVSAQQVRADDIRGCEHLADIATHLMVDAGQPRIIIGQDNVHLLLPLATRRGPANQPVATLTPLGWVLHGVNAERPPTPPVVAHMTERQVDDQLHAFFSLDALMVEPRKPKSDPEENALITIREGMTKTPAGHFQVPLPWKLQDRKMPDNYEATLRRLHNTEAKIDKDPVLKTRYTAEMDALLTKGYAEPAPQKKTPGKTWYLPHFPVFNTMKPGKIRIVHDAAAKTHGMSLNDFLHTGPDLLQSLPGVLMRFRQRPVAVGGDIKEMFMRIKICPEDRDSLRYLWRGDRRDGPPQEYRMTSLIFGATCSPSIAIYVKNANAQTYAHEHPAAALAIERNHYVDDYLASYDTTEEAMKIATAVRDIHKNAQFELRHWTSNDRRILQSLEPTSANTAVDLGGEAKQERVLGLMWKPDSDELTFNMSLARLSPDALENPRPTKRDVLRIVMSVFDPLGLVSPVTIAPKRLLQEVWRRGTDWDAAIDDDLAHQWRDWIQHLKQLRNIAVPRCYPHCSEATDVQLHVFVDASETTFAAALYWRAETKDGTVAVSLIAAKAKVAPLKLTSIPRLELQAAVLGARMAAWTIEEHDIQPSNKIFWTDSRTVLSWITTGARSFRPFVAHRIAAIEELSTTNEWRWVPTKLNVADDATRNIPPDFKSTHRWFTGPEFLHQDPKTWPEQPPGPTTPTGEERVLVCVKRDTPLLSRALPQPDRFSKWERLVRTTARVLQFIDRCRPGKGASVHYKRTRKNAQTDPTWTANRPRLRTNTRASNGNVRTPVLQTLVLDAHLLRRAETLLVMASQQEAFANEIAELASGKQPSKSSRLCKIATETVNGVLHLKTRIAAAKEVPTVQKSPPVLDGNSHLAKLFIEYTHRQLHHAGVEGTINECRQRYWILRLRTVARMVIRRCKLCARRRATPPSPPTGDHPRGRLVHHQRPFTSVGLDYFGPLNVTVGRSTQKRWVALFTCLTTRAVHLEVARTLSTDSAVMALRRFFARRGCPSEIWSDNGTNLRGADRELRRTLDAATQEEASKRTIHWRYIPPGAPFMGGAWERLVRSVKTALTTVMTTQRPPEEVLTTLLAEVEFTVNSRPLTHVSVDPDDPEAITPNHFLLLGPARVPVDGDFTDDDLIGRQHWRASQRLADAFWERWIREYLPQLQDRREPHGKGPPVEIGNVVLLVDETQPRNSWPLGVITAVHPGPDGVVRTIDVRSGGTTRRRASKKIVVLPTGDDPPTAAHRTSNYIAGAVDSTDEVRRENVRDSMDD